MLLTLLNFCRKIIFPVFKYSLYLSLFRLPLYHFLSITLYLFFFTLKDQLKEHKRNYNLFIIFLKAMYLHAELKSPKYSRKIPQDQYRFLKKLEQLIQLFEICKQTDIHTITFYIFLWQRPQFFNKSYIYQNPS